MRRRRGSVTLEFALINIPFAIFLIGFFEFVWQATTAVVVDAAVLRAARFGMTGQQVPVGAPPSITCRSVAIPWLIVHRSGGLLSESRLTVTTETFARLNDFASGTPTSGPGMGGEFTIYTVRYEQPVLTGVWQRANGGASNVVHRATITVRNEPFINATC